MSLPVFSVAIKNIITAYKHSGMLEGGAELRAASASALLMNPSDAVSSESTVCTEHCLQSSGPPPPSPGLSGTAVSQHGFILCVELYGAEEGVQLRLREYI